VKEVSVRTDEKSAFGPDVLVILLAAGGALAGACGSHGSSTGGNAGTGAGHPSGASSTSGSGGAASATSSATSSGSSSTAVSGTSSSSGSGGGTDTLPAGLGWHELSGTSIAAIDSTGFGETVTADWSGGVMDQGRHRLLLTGSGHGDCDNGIYGIQLDGNPAHAFVLSASSATPGPPNGPWTKTYPDGSPQTGHTYDGIAFIPAGSSPLSDSFVVLVAQDECPGDGSANWVTLLPMSKVQLGHPSPGSSWSFVVPTIPGLEEGEGTTSDYDPVSGLVFVTAPRFSDLLAFDSGTGKVTAITNGRPTGCDFYCTSVVDPDHHRLYAFGGNNNMATNWTWWDIAGGLNATGAETDFAKPPGCPDLAAAPGVDWDPKNHTFVIWNSSGSPSTSQLYTYNPGTTAAPDGTPAGQCRALDPPGKGPPDALYGNGTYKRFRYSSYGDCFVVVNDANQNAFIVRTR
jgi:hypothetical protein